MAKKAAPKKTAKKPAAKKAAPKKEVVKFEAKDVALNSPQSKSLIQVGKNQEKIFASANNMIALAKDSGERLIKLRDAIQGKYGRVWKAWAQTAGNLPISYEQASRYMKLAGATDAEFALIDANSIEGAVKQVEHMRKPEKAKAAAEKKAAAPKASRATSTDGTISDATIREIEECTDIEMLRLLAQTVQKRIDELSSFSPGDDTLTEQEAADGDYDGDGDVDETDAEIADELDDLING